MGLDTKTYRLTDRQSQCDFGTEWWRTGGVGSSFETAVCHDTSLGAEELNEVESSELAAAE
jgi:hypothetical protein